MVKRKKLSRGAKSREVRKLLDLGYTNKEILAELVTSENFILEIRKQIKAENALKQQEMELKSQQECFKADLVARYDEVSPIAEITINEVEKSIEKLKTIEEKANYLGTMVVDNMILSEELRKEGIDYVKKALKEGAVDPNRIAPALLKGLQDKGE